MQESKTCERETLKRLRAAGISSGVQGIAGVATGVASLAPLYSQSRADRRGSKLAEQFSESKT